eukprot:7030983-Prymnesium_polylepis.1
MQPVSCGSWAPKAQEGAGVRQGASAGAAEWIGCNAGVLGHVFGQMNVVSAFHSWLMCEISSVARYVDAVLQRGGGGERVYTSPVAVL